MALLIEYDLSKAFTFLEGYDLVLLILGLAVLAASVLPRLLFDKPLTLPMVLLALSFTVFALPLGLEFPDPLEQGKKNIPKSCQIIPFTHPVCQKSHR